MWTMIKNIISIILLAAILIIYNPKELRADKYRGNGDVTLSDSQYQNFEKYKKLWQPNLFILTGRGSYWFYCAGSDQCQSENNSTYMWRFNQSKYAKNGGKIFAEGQKIVWQGTVCYKGRVIHGSGSCSQSNLSRRKDDYMVCRLALQIDNPNWDTRYPKEIAEAKKRGYSASECFALSGYTASKSKSIRTNKEVIEKKGTDLNSDNKGSVKERLIEIKNLLQEGLISKEDAEKQRKIILKDL